MSDKGSRPVARLISNKIFITLLIFAIAIIFVSAAFNRSIQKVSVEQPEYTADLPVITETDEEVVPSINEYEETPTVPVEAEEENQEIKYRLPLAGELQKQFSDSELLWDDTMQDWRTHKGVDIEAEDGTEVVTAAPGTVIEAREDEMYGFTVMVQHNDGIVTVYKNLGKTVVEKDDVLDEGQMIGTVGSSGMFEIKQKPHLHFEVVSEDKNINPLDFIK